MSRLNLNEFVSISVLTKEEIEAHDMLISLAERLDKLPDTSKIKIYRRWLMLHMMNEYELKNFVKWLDRVSTPK